jgi:glyoxylase-like metal-dependent hydrolase (beta-lactamase superfamily II)
MQQTTVVESLAGQQQERPLMQPAGITTPFKGLLGTLLAAPRYAAAATARLYLQALPRLATYGIEPVCHNIYRVTGPHTAAKNVYVVSGEALVVIDPPLHVPATAIGDALSVLGMSLADVDAIICTHYHVDHAGAAKDIIAESAAPIYAHQTEIPFLRGEKPHTFPNAGRWYRPLLRAGLDLLPNWHLSRIEPITEGDTLSCLPGYTVLHTPGHTPGCISLYNEKLQLAFTGDALQHHNDKLRVAPPRFSMDLRAEYASAVRLATLPLEIILPSDGTPVVSDAQQKCRRYLGGSPDPSP